MHTAIDHVVRRKTVRRRTSWPEAMLLSLAWGKVPVSGTLSVRHPSCPMARPSDAVQRALNEMIEAKMRVPADAPTQASKGK